MFNQDYDGQNPDAPLDYNNPPDPTASTPNGVNMTLLGYDGQTEVYQGSDGQRYVVGPNGANGLSTWAPYTGSATTFSQTPGTQQKTVDPTQQPPTTGAPPPPTSAGPNGSPYPSGAPAPVFTPPPVQQAPAFSYGDFVAPQPSDLENDPFYKYTLKTEQDAIARSAAARAVLNTGGTVNDLLGNAAGIASAGYKDLFGRAFQTYSANRANAAENYRTNYDTQFQDPWSQRYKSAQDVYDSQQHNFDLGNSYAWANRLFGEQQANDAFDRKFRIFSAM